MVYLLTFLSAIASIIGNVLGKVWADRQDLRWLAWMFVSFTISSLAYAYSLRYGKYTIVNAMFYAIVPVITAVTGIYFFKEKLTTLQTTGLLLGVVSIILLTMEGKVAR
ncbi:MAG TPA: SMR family transporter [Candidatus Methylomirabilis sp.]|nr:SMR family transporter [Candidatus Methylomirabilis sp.]